MSRHRRGRGVAKAWHLMNTDDLRHASASPARPAGSAGFLVPVAVLQVPLQRQGAAVALAPEHWGKLRLRRGAVERDASQSAAIRVSEVMDVAGLPLAEIRQVESRGASGLEVHVKAVLLQSGHAVSLHASGAAPGGATETLDLMCRGAVAPVGCLSAQSGAAGRALRGGDRRAREGEEAEEREAKGAAAGSEERDWWTAPGSLPDARGSTPLEDLREQRQADWIHTCAAWPCLACLGVTRASSLCGLDMSWRRRDHPAPPRPLRSDLVVQCAITKDLLSVAHWEPILLAIADAFFNPILTREELARMAPRVGYDCNAG